MFLLRRLLALVVPVVLAACSNSSSAYGTPQDCAAAGGRCQIGGIMCLKEGPPNTCNCNPGCNPGGAVCCIAFVDASE